MSHHAGQVLLLEMEGLLAEKYRPSLWKKLTTSAVRPGVVDGLRQLSRHFYLCALCHSAPAVSEELLGGFRARGCHFDAAFCTPSARGSAPALTPALISEMCDEIGIPPSELSQRALLVASLELEHDDVEQREGVGMLLSPEKRRSHVRVLVPGIVSLLVPHPRLQPQLLTVVMEELARLILKLHEQSPRNWAAAYEKLDGGCELKKLRAPLPSPAAPRFSLRRWSSNCSITASHSDSDSHSDADAAPKRVAEQLDRFLVVLPGRLAKSTLAPYELATWRELDNGALDVSATAQPAKEAERAQSEQEGRRNRGNRDALEGPHGDAECRDLISELDAL